jgi:hypothetical protein
MKYQYSTTLTSDRVRLVQIAENNSTEAISLHIEEYAISSLPPYNALSYTWDSPCAGDKPYDDSDKIPISLDGQGFTIFPNLAAFLRRLRGLRNAKYYWIDAICINQDDINEREVQVGIMDQIYRQADHVDIWIGESGQYDTEVAEMVTRMAQVADAEVGRMYNERQTWQLFDFLDDSIMRGIGLPSLNEDIWDAFIDFFERRWFKRAWILQEVALANDAALLWGEGTIPWSSIALCSEFLTTSNLSRGLAELKLRKHPTNNHITQIGTSSEAIHLVQQLCRGRAAELDEEYVSCLARMAGFSEKTRVAAHYLLLLLLVSREFQATDGRDKIFALLGVMNHLSNVEGLDRPDIKPSYGNTSTIATAFTQAAISIMRDCNHIGILTLVPDISVAKVQDLPSWVPDFTVQGPNPILTLIRSEEMASFNASGLESSDGGHFRIDGNELYLNAIQIGSIIAISEPCLDFTNKGHFELAAALLLKCPAVYGPTGQSRIEAFWRTLILDMDEFNSPTRPELGESFRHWMAYLVLKGVQIVKESNETQPLKYLENLQNLQCLSTSDPSGIIPSSDFLHSCSRRLGLLDDEDVEDGDDLIDELRSGLQDYQSVAFTSLPYRRLFLTDSGYMGLGPQSLEKRDMVFLVAGCPSPLILRRSSFTFPGASFLQIAFASLLRRLAWLRNLLCRMLGVRSRGTSICWLDSSKYRQLIGEAYVHGAMHGEAVEKNAKWEPVCLR